MKYRIAKTFAAFSAVAAMALGGAGFAQASNGGDDPPNHELHHGRHHEAHHRGDHRGRHDGRHGGADDPIGHR